MWKKPKTSALVQVLPPLGSWLATVCREVWVVHEIIGKCSNQSNHKVVFGANGLFHLVPANNCLLTDWDFIYFYTYISSLYFCDLALDNEGLYTLDFQQEFSLPCSPTQNSLFWARLRERPLMSEYSKLEYTQWNPNCLKAELDSQSFRKKKKNCKLCIYRK